MYGLNCFLLQLKGCLLETYWWQEVRPTSIGNPVTAAARVGVGI